MTLSSSSILYSIHLANITTITDRSQRLVYTILEMRSRVSSSLQGGGGGGSSRTLFSSFSFSTACTPHHPLLRRTLFRFRPQSRQQPSQPRQYTSTSASSPDQQRIVRPLVPPPREGSGPLLSRRPDRALPNISRTSIWIKTLPVFVALIGLSSLAIFNYQKSSSSTVNSILYALRTNPHARELLGDEIYFASQVPWIRGELSPMQGTIDITFWVKGTKGTAQTKFVSIRKKGAEFFETLEWSLQSPGADGQSQTIQLLEMEGTRDPIAGQKI